MESKKSNKGLIVLIIFLILVILGLTGYIVFDKYYVPNNSDIKDTDTKEENKKEESILIDKDKDIVYTVGNYKYKQLPYININSDDAKEINKEIEDYANDNGKDSDYGEFFYLNYDYYLNDNVLSVVIKINNDTPYKKYKTFNIDNKTGKRISNYKLLEMKNIDSNGLNDKIFEIYSNKDNIDSDKQIPVMYDNFTSVYDANKISITDTLITDYNMYINKENELCVIKDIYTIAGAGAFNAIFNMNKNIIEN